MGIMKLKKILKNKIPKDKAQLVPSSFDIIGDIAILEIKPEIKKYEKLIAETLLKEHKNLKTILKKAGIHKGEYRTQKLKILSGEKRKTTTYKESGVLIKLDVEKCYFSPRLSNERLRIAKQVKPNEEILVMFSGVSPFPLVISKNSKAKEIYAIEINQTAHKYAEENLKLNKVGNIGLHKGDVRKVLPRIKKKFDRILMPLPKDSPTFLDLAIKKIKKNGIIHLYLFSKEEDIKNVRKIIKDYIKKFRILKVVKVGQYSPGVYRICVDFTV